MEQKSFKELNLNNAFLFSAAMGDPETCQLALECILDRNIRKINVRTECSLLYSSDFKCIRLDVLGNDEMDVSYDLEMQNHDEKNLPKRSRYYQAELDLASLKPGEDYDNLKPLFVIFICNFDPFDRKLYRYTFEMQCLELGFSLNDGVKRIFLNISGENAEDISPSLMEFLGYLNNSTDEYVATVRDQRIHKIHENIKALKKNRNLEAGYMRFDEFMRDNYNDGKKDGLAEGQKLGLAEGQKLGLAEGLQALVATLCTVLPDVDTVYQKVIANETYCHVTKEQIETYFHQFLMSEHNSENTP